MISTYKIIGFSLNLNPSKTITVTPYSANDRVSQYEEVILEASIENKISASSVKVNLELPNGDIVKNLHLLPVLGQPNKFNLRLTEAIGQYLTLGEVNTIDVIFEVVSEGAIYSSESQEVSYTLYKTNTDAEFTPDDIDVLFIGLNKSMQKLADIEANSSGVYVEGNPSGTSTNTLDKIKIDKIVYDIPKTDLSDYYNKKGTEDAIDKKIAAIPEPDLKDYYKKNEVYNRSETLSEIDKKIAAIPGTDLNNYYKKSETYSRSETLSEIDKKIANIPGTDLKDYYKKSETYSKQQVDDKVKEIEIPKNDQSALDQYLDPGVYRVLITDNSTGNLVKYGGYHLFVDETPNGFKQIKTAKRGYEERLYTKNDDSFTPWKKYYYSVDGTTAFLPDRSYLEGAIVWDAQTNKSYVSLKNQNTDALTNTSSWKPFKDVITSSGAGGGFNKVVLFQGAGDSKGVINDLENVYPLIMFEVSILDKTYFLSIPGDVDYERINLNMVADSKNVITILFDGIQFSVNANTLPVDNVNVYGFR